MLIGKPGEVQVVPLDSTIGALTTILASLVQSDTAAAGNDEPERVRRAIQDSIVATAKAITTLNTPSWVTK